MSSSFAPLAFFVSPAQHLRTPDLLIIAGYLVAITLFGLHFRNHGAGQDRSLKGYFLAGNTVPWWAIALSVVSAETSTLTIISIPGVAFAGNFGFLQVVLGYLVGRVVVAALFLPRYFAGEMLTAYQLIDRRFGAVLHKVTAGLFLITRAAAEGVRIFAVSIVVTVAIGTGDVLSIAIITALTLLYTFEGGLAAVIWTDVVQMGIYVLGTVVAVISLGHHVPGGWSHIAAQASAAGKFHTFNFAFNLTQSYTFWAGLLGGTFLTMASHGTDQLMVQRLLAARSLRESRLALLSSGVVIFAQFAFFLLIGAGLWVFYGAGAAGTFRSNDYIFPTFITREMPTGIAGLLVAAILAAAMSNLSAALNSLSSTTVIDFYIRARPQASDRERTLVAKSSTVLWALVLFAIAIVSLHAGGKGHVVEIGLSIASVAYGCLLGVFLLGTLTRFANQTGTAIGMITGFALNLWLWQGTFPKVLYQGAQGTRGGRPDGTSFATYIVPPITIPHIAFTWYVLIGAVVTFAVGALASVVLSTFRTRTLKPVTAATLLPFLFLSFSERRTCFAQAQAQAQTQADTKHPTAPHTLVPTNLRVVTPTTKLAVILSAAKDPRILAAGTAPSAQNSQDPTEPPTAPHFATLTLPLPLSSRSAAEGSAFLPPPTTQAPNAPQQPTPQPQDPTKQRTDPHTPNPANLPAQPIKVTQQPTADFTQISQLITAAIAKHQLPGAVVAIGHGGEIVFHQAYGNRKLDGEPGLDGKPSPAEPMTEDTIFDMASLTKCIVTTTAVMQLYEQGKIDLDAPIERYLPDFNPTHDPQRTQVTLRLLLTHFSGEAPDINLKDAWGLATPDKAEGIHRALTNPLAGSPGTKMVYSDINFILLGALVEKLSGQRLDDYARERIFQPLGMQSTRYLPFDRACGANTLGAAVIGEHETRSCSTGTWSPLGLGSRTAPTAHDDEGTAATNPDFNHLLRGTVHDPTTRRMGGVAGHAGVFSTAHDMSLFAQALLDRYAGRPSMFPLQRKTLMLMTMPQQPGHTPFQVGQHFRADQSANKTGAPSSATASPSPKVGSQNPAPPPHPLLSPNYPAIKDQPLRGFGWDIDSGYSKPRGHILPIGGFGHTGFTGTSLWLDPGSDTFILLLSNAIHPHAGAAISNLRGEVASAAALALGLYPDQIASSRPKAEGRSGETPVFAPAQAHAAPDDLTQLHRPTPPASPDTATEDVPPTKTPRAHFSLASYSPPRATSPNAPRHAQSPHTHTNNEQQTKDNEKLPVQTGIDILESTHFAALAHLSAPNQPLRLALLTNQTGLDSTGRRTVDILATDLPKTISNAKLVTLFSPEHGIFGQQDTEHLTGETDPTTGLHVTSLYGAHDVDRRPSHDQLKDLDAVLIDLQDAGLRCFTYETVLGYFLEAAATERTQFQHDLHILVLDRPNPLGGLAVAGPTSDPGAESYINYMPIPLQHGLTFGELARYINTAKHLNASLTVVQMQGWHRDQMFDETGLPWTPPSPNLHTSTAATVYPATSMLELTNLSVGRGTSLAFEVFGADPATAPWFNAQAVINALLPCRNAKFTFEIVPVSVPEDRNRYPGHGHTFPAVHIVFTTPDARIGFDGPALGAQLLSTLHKLYPFQFQLDKATRLVANHATVDALARGDDPKTIAASWQPGLEQFRNARQSSLLY